MSRRVRVGNANNGIQPQTLEEAPVAEEAKPVIAETAEAPPEGSEQALAQQRLTQGPQGMSFNEFRQKYDTGQDSLWSLVGLEEADGTVTAKEISKAGGFQPLSRDIRAMRPADRKAAMNMMTPQAKTRLARHMPKPPPPPRANPHPPLRTPPKPAAQTAPVEQPVRVPAGYKQAPTLEQVEAKQGLLKQGMAGESVREIQKTLIAEGHLAEKNARGGTNANGVFNSDTKRAVERYQVANKLGKDGVVGSQTLGHMRENAAPEANKAGKPPEAPTQTDRADRTEGAEGAERADRPALDVPASYGEAPSLQEVKDGEKLMKRGMGGEPVQDVQLALIEKGYLPEKSASGRPNADGAFGGGTKAAVQRFQRENGLNPDGVVGKDTFAKLFPDGVPKPQDAAKTEGETTVEEGEVRAADDRELYLPEIKDFKPGVYGRGTREIEVQQARLQKRIDATDDPQEKERLRGMQKEWEACSFHTTRRAAEIAGVSYGRMLEETGDPTGVGREGFGAWHKRGVVLKNGGESVWTPKEGRLEDSYDDIQVGDFVSLGNGSMSKHAQRYPDLEFEEGVRHSGVVVGRNKDGVPIVEHNFGGEVYREPINDLTRAKLKYKAMSVFRAEPFKDTGAVKTRMLDAENAKLAKRAWRDADPFTAPVQLTDTDERRAVNEYVSAYQDVRQAFGEEYGITPEHADRTFQDLLAIGVQESNFDNNIVRTSDDDLASVVGDMGKQWFTDDTHNPVKWVAREAVRGVRNWDASVSESEARANRAYNREHGLLPNVPGWKKEIEVAGMMKDQGLSYEDAAAQVNARYGRWETAHSPSGLKSHGTFKIKDVPEKVRIAFDGAANSHGEDGSYFDRFYKDARGNVLAGMGLYERNYQRARETFPEHTLPQSLGWGEAEKEDFYRSIARIAHNAPTKAFSPEFVNFYVAPVISGPENDPNPDRSRFKVDYDARVVGYRKEMWGQ